MSQFLEVRIWIKLLCCPVICTLNLLVYEHINLAKYAMFNQVNYCSIFSCSQKQWSPVALFFLSKIMHVIFIYLVYLSRIHMDSLNRILSIFMSLIMECLSYVCARAWMLSFFFSDGVFSFVIIPATRLSDYEYCE